MSVDVLSRKTLYSDLVPPLERAAQPAGDVRLPVGTVVVSADNHWSIADDIFYERFPDHLKDRAPRVVNDDGALIFHIGGQNIFTNNVMKILRMHDTVPGNHRLAPRMKDMDVAGIQKELVFGNAIGALYSFPDVEVREWIFRSYNQYLSDLQKDAPGRFYGVGLINFWQPERSADSIAELKELGIKTFVIPQIPYGADRKPISYCDPAWEPMWQAIEDAGLPVCFHVGEFSPDSPGGIGLAQLQNFGPYRKNFGELVFGGIFDRHPRLQVIFAEADLNWIPGTLQNADMLYDQFGHILDPQIEHSPTYYWHRNCHATFMSDPIGLKMIDLIGVDKVMWSMDYAHPESVFGCGWDSMQEIIDHIPSDEGVKKILGGNAIRLFDL